MTEYIYSPSANMFYPNVLKSDYIAAGAWPDDGIDVSLDTVREFTASRTGWVRVAGSDGLPAWEEAPAPVTPYQPIAPAE